jgi:hypothetical protein
MPFKERSPLQKFPDYATIIFSVGAFTAVLIVGGVLTYLYLFAAEDVGEQPPLSQTPAAFPSHPLPYEPCQPVPGREHRSNCLWQWTRLRRRLTKARVSMGPNVAAIRFSCPCLLVAATT